MLYHYSIFETLGGISRSIISLLSYKLYKRCGLLQDTIIKRSITLLRIKCNENYVESDFQMIDELRLFKNSEKR